MVLGLSLTQKSRSSCCDVQKRIWLASRRTRVWSVGRGSSIALSCGIGHRCGSDPLLLWLWHRPATTAPIWPLAWDLPCAVGAALKSKKKKRKRKEKEKKESISLPAWNQFCYMLMTEPVSFWFLLGSRNGRKHQHEWGSLAGTESADWKVSLFPKLSMAPRVGSPPASCLCLPLHRLVSKESCGCWPEREALHQNQPVSWKWCGYLLPARKWSHALPVSAWVRKKFFYIIAFVVLYSTSTLLGHLVMTVHLSDGG